MKKKSFKKQNAFTLAEVLITLAIIGVVAALTIPSVITNYRKNLYVTQLKKEYNYIINAFHTAMARDGVTRLSDTKLWASITSITGGPPMASSFVDYDEFKEQFLKIFNVSKIYDGSINNKIPVENNAFKSLDGIAHNFGANYVSDGVCLVDGSCFTFQFYKTPTTRQCGSHACVSLKEFQEVNNTPTKFWQWVGYVNIDVNGFQKGPNQLGRDYFLFQLGNDGNLYPHYGVDYAVMGGSYEGVIANNNSYYWKYNENKACNPNAPSSGSGCAARIMEEGWKMNY